MKNLTRPWLFFGAVALLFNACASTGTASPEAAPTPRPAPAWVLTQPASTATTEIFVASGTEANEGRAEEAAILSLLQSINLYMGVDISSVTEAEARGSLESYEASVRSAVTQRASGVVAGLSIKDRYSVRGADGLYTVYVLCEYNKVDLEKEKAKRAALVKEQEDAVSVPEARGRSAEQGGDLYGALLAYLEAAGVASGSEIRNADVKFERNVNSASKMVGRLVLERVSAPASVLARQAFAEDFVVVVKDSQTGKPVAGVDFEVSWNEYTASGTARVSRSKVKSDAQGLVKVRPNAPTRAGTERITFALDVSAYTRTISNLRGDFRTVAANLLDNINTTRTVVEYVVDSRARTIATSVIVGDLNASGALVRGSTLGMDAVKQALTAAGFRVPNLAVGPQFLEGKADEDIIALSKNTMGAAGPRFAFGTVQVLGFDKLAGGISARATGRITAIEVATGTILYSYSRTASAMGTTEEEARRNALSALGRELGNALVSNLP